jgi:hypothetical protein
LETTRKKALEIMQKGIVIYKLVNSGWDVSEHFGDGYDLIAFKDKNTVKIELKAIDLNAIKDGNKATQHLTANEIISSTHIILTIFNHVDVISTYIMSVSQFVDVSLPRTYLNEYKNFQEFLPEYISLATEQRNRKKGDQKGPRLDFDIYYNNENSKRFRYSSFHEKWDNLR